MIANVGRQVRFPFGNVPRAVKGRIKKYFLEFFNASIASFLGGVIGFIPGMVLFFVTLFMLKVMQVSPDFIILAFVAFVLPVVPSGYLHGFLYKRFVTSTSDYKQVDVLIAKNPDGTHQVGERVWAKDGVIPIRLPLVYNDGKFIFEGSLRGVPLKFEAQLRDRAKVGDPLRGFSADELYNVATFEPGKGFDVGAYIASKFIEQAEATASVPMAFARYPYPSGQNTFVKAQMQYERTGLLMDAMKTVDFGLRRIGLSCVSSLTVTIAQPLFVRLFM